MSDAPKPTLSPEERADLKACPFCSEQADVEHSYHEDNHRYPRDFWHVRVCCTACDCRQSWSLYGEQEQRNIPAKVKAEAEAHAVALWNNRPEETRLLTALEEAEGQIRMLCGEVEDDADNLSLATDTIEALTARAEKAEQQSAERDAIISDILQCHDEGPGLIDCIDNRGERYTSAGLDAAIQHARALSPVTQEGK